MRLKLGAFTLAEVLITLGIIGVVAAMTLPTLQQRIDSRRNITALKKFYTEFYQATNLLISEYGEPENWGLRDNDAAASQNILDMYREQFNMVKVCGNGDSSCLSFPIYKYDGTIAITSADYSGWALKSFILNNGTAVFLDVNNGNLAVFFDVNGNKNPNRLGEDVFAWVLNGEGRIVPFTDPSVTSGFGDADYNYAFEIMQNGWEKKY